MLWPNLSIYVCVKLSPRDLNHSPCPPHRTNIYTCRVTTIPRVCGGISDVKDTTVRNITQSNNGKTRLIEKINRK